MPTALHPQAKFDPFPPDLDLHGLVDRIPNFKWVQKVSRDQIRRLDPLDFEKLIHIHVVSGGKPLVIEGWDALLPKWLFNVEWLEKAYDRKEENVRDILAETDIPMTMGHYLRSMRQLTNQWTPQNFRDERRQRLYLKDIDCPPEWQTSLQQILHPSLFYLNENVTAHQSAGPEQQPSLGDCQDDGVKTIATAGDLMSSLPKAMRAENLMCYIGHEGTFTPAHREMCASLGQNIMVEASTNNHGDKSGSSVWFMTESKDRDVVREYFLSMLGHDIEIEKHFAQINAWKKAPFDVYIVEQRPGDFIIIPPLAAHQVWNTGTRTMKVAWNRTTPETLRLALHEALPKARLVCRDEQYKNKAIIYFTLDKYSRLLQEIEKEEELTQNRFIGIGRDIIRSSPRATQLSNDFKSLFKLYLELLIDETFAYRVKNVEMLPFDSCVTCSYCRSNIFNRFLTCKHCIRTLTNGDEDAYDVCMECYAMGRSCACMSGLQWCEQWHWDKLIEKYESWREMVINNDGFIDLHSSPPPFEVARKSSGKKSVAQICQEALLRRPWRDITKDDYGREPDASDREDAGDKPKKKSKRKQKEGDVRRCHVCCHKDYSYRVHECSNQECSEAYCYGVLYRAFDMMPQAVQQDEFWQCPKCQGICNCAHCRRAGNTKPYTPRNTSLGHDTKSIADDRSIEALVDFRVHNLSWLKAAGEESRSRNSRRMQRLRQQADNAKAENVHQKVAINTGSLSEEQENSEPGHAMLSPARSDSPLDRTQAHQGEWQSLAERSINSAAPDEVQEASLSRSQISEPDALNDDHDSLYPDPSAGSNYGIGMGYYQQDDSPDKILFDVYKEPTSNATWIADDGLPDSVRKSIRAAKRKARRDNEDPDFTLGRSRHKRSRPDNNADLLLNMDPALFNPGSSLTSSLSPRSKRQEISQSRRGVHGTDVTAGADGPAELTSAASSDSHELLLRHAKPMTSYVEMENPEEEEGEDSAHPDSGLGDNKAAKLSADRTSLTTDDTKDAENPVHEKTASAASLSGRGRGVRRRGRPTRKAPRQGEKSGDSAAQSPLAPTEPSDALLIRRGHGRGRDRRSQAVPRILSNTTTPISSPTCPALDDPLQVKDPLEPTMRLPRRGLGSLSSKDLSTPIPPSSKTELDDFVEQEAEGSRRSSGRPRRLIKPLDESLPRPKTSSIIGQEFMSMAERLAMKGKKFRIGQRKSVKRQPSDMNVEYQDSRMSSSSPTMAASSASQTNSPRAEAEREKHIPTSTSSEILPEIIPSNYSSKKGAVGSGLPHASAPLSCKTVVRLADMISSDEDCGTAMERGDVIVSSDDSDESDIPASASQVLISKSIRLDSSTPYAFHRHMRDQFHKALSSLTFIGLAIPFSD
ncbi:JmjC domain-containing protein [Moelleriella libera RCEF 2490]|uniref:JmjC domain-containing protein n=1 Tax=Moelleriella libera RCEF 2490 TaxID=1081109 RepID=A0A166VHX4_9HYPO|nr:JmjC domain-containing protein [Moelleriella libera RCEF 2490]